jgi:hypothetical protein
VRHLIRITLETEEDPGIALERAQEQADVLADRLDAKDFDACTHVSLSAMWKYDFDITLDTEAKRHEVLKQARVIAEVIAEAVSAEDFDNLTDVEVYQTQR